VSVVVAVAADAISVSTSTSGRTVVSCPAIWARAGMGTPASNASVKRVVFMGNS
jgi:hypothetical protein